MKKLIILTLCIITGLFILCGCEGDTVRVTDQTGHLKYQIAEGWNAETVSPSPSEIKEYRYNGTTVRIEALSYRFYEDPLQEALDYAVGAMLESDGVQAGYEQEPAGETTVAEMPAKEMYLKSSDIDGSFMLSGMFTAIQTETGLYVVSTTTESEELDNAARKAHQTLKESIEYVTSSDNAVFAENVLQFTDYICAVPAGDIPSMDVPWWTERVEYDSGIINYVFGSNISSLCVIPMNDDALTDEVIIKTLEMVYNGKLGPEASCTIAGREMLEAAVGSALYVETGLSFGEDASAAAKSSAVFVMDTEGKPVCCFTNTADSDLSFDYTAMTVSIQKADTVYTAIDNLYNNATDYAGDNTKIINLLNILEAGVYGDYTIHLHTDKEPYGMTVEYSGDITGYDFQREAVMMLGLVGNLDYIKIKDSNSNIVEYDYELAKSLLKYDVKKMASDKALLTCYYLETLY